MVALWGLTSYRCVYRDLTVIFLGTFVMYMCGVCMKLE